MDEEFEYDPVKSAANREKHGIDFEAAQALWREAAYVQDLPYRGEAREMRTGQIDGKLWSAVYTKRRSAIRLILVRRARKNEVENYERNISEQRDDDEP
jgi:uncharacterized DUF497 family protein